MTNRRHSQSLSLALIFSLASAPAALSHDQWANGAKVPEWVKESCCGESEAHQLTPAQVHLDKDGNYYFDNSYQGKVKSSKALPSQDGQYWIFYACPNAGCVVHCFFAPMEF